MDKGDLKELLQRYTDGKCTEEEVIWIESWYLQNSPDFPLDLSEQEIEEDLDSVLSALPVCDSPKKLSLWPGIAARAALVIITGSIVFFTQRPVKIQTLAKHQNHISQEIMPGSNKAVLILDNGSEISLTDAAVGELAQQSGTAVTKTADGNLIYTAVTRSAKSSTSNAAGNLSTPQIAYNTIQTPVGGQYQLTLPDETRVWLNSASSLRYPTEFAGKERVVELKGEGYFEVAKLKSKPFRVVTTSQNQKQEIEVLGTHFNINAYHAEQARTTLVEGSVKVSRYHLHTPEKEAQSRTLKPGQQSVLNNHSVQVQDADLEAVLAWKNGYFVFNNTNIKNVLEEMERWYDIQISFQQDLDDLTMAGSIPRSYKLSQAVHLMELTGNFKFKIEGRRLIVMR